MNRTVRALTALSVASLTAIGGLTACGSNTKKEAIRVVTYYAGSDLGAPVWKGVVEDYMKANPNVTIVDESQPTAGANDMLKTKVSADIAAKTPPDLMLYYTGDAYNKIIEESGLFTDLAGYLKDDTGWASHFKEAPLKSVRYEGKQYSLPYSGFYEGLFYNKGLFDKYNLKEPTSWANIMASISVFNANGIVPLSVSLSMPYFMTENFIMAQAGEAKHRDYFGDSWAGALDGVAQLYKAGAFPKDSMTLSDDDTRALFTEGRAAMIINGSWCVDAFKKNPDIRIISMPATPGGAGGEKCAIAGFGSGWFMSKAASARSAETLKFLKYITSPETMARFAVLGGGVAIDCELPSNVTNLEISAKEMLDKATYVDKTLDSQVGHEAYEVMNGGLQYIVENQKTSLDILREARALDN